MIKRKLKSYFMREYRLAKKKYKIKGDIEEEYYRGQIELLEDIIEILFNKKFNYFR